MPELIAVLIAAFIMDLLIGDPPYPYHPVRIMGWWIHYLEEKERRLGWDGLGGGLILLLLMTVMVLAAYLSLQCLLSLIHPWLARVWNIFLCYSCLALGDLFNHIKPVIRALESADLGRTKGLLARVVGRDVQALDGQALARAALETLGENFVDGFLSPVFWYVTGGILGIFTGDSPVRAAVIFMLLFKLASTLDSMIGYKNSRYIRFGRAGARLDDCMNFVPARLSLFFLFWGAALTGLHAFRGLKTALRDRLKHDSPNAAHAESFLAGALGIRLGGPTPYPEGLVNKPWLGDGVKGADPVHLERAVALVRASGWSAIITLLGLFLFIYYG